MQPWRLMNKAFYDLHVGWPLYQVINQIIRQCSKSRSRACIHGYMYKQQQQQQQTTAFEFCDEGICCTHYYVLVLAVVYVVMVMSLYE